MQQLVRTVSRCFCGTYLGAGNAHHCETCGYVTPQLQRAIRRDYKLGLLLEATVDAWYERVKRNARL